MFQYQKGSRVAQVSRYGDARHCREGTDKAFCQMWVRDCAPKFLEAHLALISQIAEARALRPRSPALPQALSARQSCTAVSPGAAPRQISASALPRPSCHLSRICQEPKWFVLNPDHPKP